MKIAEVMLPEGWTSYEADGINILPSGCLEITKGDEVVVIYSAIGWESVKPRD